MKIFVVVVKVLVVPLVVVLAIGFFLGLVAAMCAPSLQCWLERLSARAKAGKYPNEQFAQALAVVRRLPTDHRLPFILQLRDAWEEKPSPAAPRTPIVPRGMKGFH